MKHCLTVVIIALSSFSTVEAGTFFSFRVHHDHFWGKGLGRLSINGDGIRFCPENDQTHARTWSYSDIQELRIYSAKIIRVLTYEDVRWKLNRDRVFEFMLLEHEITPDLVRFLRERLPIRLVSSVFSSPKDTFYRVQAKHGHALGGGCDGELVFAESAIYYISINTQHRRVWPISEIESLGLRSHLDFRITIREHSKTGNNRNFQFQLKRPMDADTFDQIWRKVYEPKTWLDRLNVAKDKCFSDCSRE